MSKLKLLLLTLAVAGLAFGLAACGGDDDDGDGEAPEDVSFELQIGDLVPLTGDLSQFGPPGEKAADLAVDELNNAIGETDADVTVSVSHADTETVPQAAQSAARQLVSDGATCLAGAWASANTIPVGRTVAAAQQIPLISPASTSPEITDLPDDGFVFRTAPSDALQGIVLADAVEAKFGTDAVISTAARNDAYGEGIITNFVENWEEKGGQATGPVLYDVEQASYNSEAGQIVEGGPDGYVIIDFEEPYIQVGSALARTGDFDPANLFTADGLAFDQIPDSIPADALDGASGTRPSVRSGPAADAFDELFTSAPGPGRQTFDAQNFDAVMLCALAAIAAGSNEGTAIQEQVQAVSAPPGDQYDWTQLTEAIEALLAGDDIDFEGVSGPINLDDNGDPTAATYEEWSYQNGKLSVKEETDIAAEE
ncbi:MAG TPA: ABC transporter substrate-binding protein [Solirubrobacterales bacterium]|nr:ABC transporter substrate-binding protein [Solirubrobacterales bacterium]